MFSQINNNNKRIFIKENMLQYCTTRLFMDKYFPLASRRDDYNDDNDNAPNVYPAPVLPPPVKLCDVTIDWCLV